MAKSSQISQYIRSPTPEDRATYLRAHKLRAAAPDMAEALRAALDYTAQTYGYRDMPPWVSSARAALAKAGVTV